MPPKKLIRKSRGKRKGQIIHFSDRYKERIELNINDNQYTQIVNRIKKGKKGKVKFIRKQSNRVTIWEMMFEGELIKVVYDKKTKAAVTVMPLLNSITLSELIGERSLS